MPNLYLTLDEWIFFLAQVITIFGIGVWPDLSTRIANAISGNPPKS
jgi:hypothetical protein